MKRVEYIYQVDTNGNNQYLKTDNTTTTNINDAGVVEIDVENGGSSCGHLSKNQLTGRWFILPACV